MKTIRKLRNDIVGALSAYELSSKLEYSIDKIHVLYGAVASNVNLAVVLAVDWPVASSIYRALEENAN